MLYAVPEDSVRLEQLRLLALQRRRRFLRMAAHAQDTVRATARTRWRKRVSAGGREEVRPSLSSSVARAQAYYGRRTVWGFPAWAVWASTQPEPLCEREDPHVRGMEVLARRHVDDIIVELQRNNVQDARCNAVHGSARPTTSLCKGNVCMHMKRHVMHARLHARLHTRAHPHARTPTSRRMRGQTRQASTREANAAQKKEAGKQDKARQ